MATATESGGVPHIYVVGELEEPHGYVKIGVHYGKPSSIGRSGLGSGNWRQLCVLHHHQLPEDTVRWHEFLIHAHLQPWLIRGEWFDVRGLLSEPNGWPDLLERAYRSLIPGGATVDRGTPEHHLETIRMMRWRPPREIAAECSCGHVMHASRTTLPAVYKRFLRDHAHTTTNVTGGAELVTLERRSNVRR